MNTPTRLIAGIVALGLVAAACASDDTVTDTVAATDTVNDPSGAPTPAASSELAEPVAQEVLDSGATVRRFEADSVTVHTYTNPVAGFANTTAVFESDSALVLVDTHFSSESAADFRAYAEAIGKPIDRVLITHDHPDHIGGIPDVFGDVTTASSAGVVAGAADAGITITDTIDAGEIEVDGVTYRVEILADAEAEEQIVITLPDEGVVAIGDLAYSDVHAVMAPTFDNWIGHLEGIAETDVQLVIPGHGTPGPTDVITEMIDYLDTARTVYADSDDADAFESGMVDAYPELPGENLLGFGSLFPKVDS